MSNAQAIKAHDLRLLVDQISSEINSYETSRYDSAGEAEVALASIVKTYEQLVALAQNPLYRLFTICH